MVSYPVEGDVGQQLVFGELVLVATGTVDGASVAPHPARASSNGAKLRRMVIGISGLEVKIIAVMCRAS